MKKIANLSKSDIEVNVYTSNDYPFIVEIVDKKKGKIIEKKAFFDSSDIVNYVDKYVPHDIDITKELPEDTNLLDMLEQEGVVFAHELIPHFSVGDRVSSNIYPSGRFGTVVQIEHTGMHRYPLIWVKWDNGDTTPEMPMNLSKVEK